MKGYEFLIDTREKGPFKAMVLRHGIPHRVTTLDADIVLRKLNPPEDIVGIERKSVADLVQSIHTRYSHGFHKKPRLFEQMDRMKRCFKISFLLISGDLKKHEQQLYHSIKRRINKKVIWGTLSSVIVRQGILVMWLPDDDTLIEVAHRICVKVSEGKLNVTKDDGPKFLSYHPKNALMLIPGVTSKISDRVLVKWPTLYSLTKATRDELKTVDGVGPALAINIYDFLHKKVSKW